MESLDQKYSNVMTEKLLKIYYKSLFFKEHFDIHYFLKNIKLDDNFLDFLSQKLFLSIPKESSDIIVQKYTYINILNDIKESVKEIFKTFNDSGFELNDYYHNIGKFLKQYDCQQSTFGNLFNRDDKFSNMFYIEKYFRVEDYENSVISSRSEIYKNVCNKTTFRHYINTDALFLSIPEQERFNQFKSIKQGIRIIYLLKDVDLQNIEKDQLKSEQVAIREKMWCLFGRNTTSQEENSVIKFPYEVCKEETINLLGDYDENPTQNFSNDELFNINNRELLSSLINNSDYIKFYEKIIPIKFINLMLYGEFKSVSILLKEVALKNNLFSSLENLIFNNIKNLINYKELVK